MIKGNHGKLLKVSTAYLKINGTWMRWQIPFLYVAENSPGAREGEQQNK